MNRLAILLAILLSASLPARAERSPVLVELYTAQGCASCPPADALLAELSANPDVVALALHVDYWDYLGWQDAFGAAAFSARQHAYAARRGDKMVYTPQMVIDGAHFVVGSKEAEVAEALMARAAAARPVEIAAQPAQVVDGARQVEVSLSGRGIGEAPCDVFVAIVEPRREVAISGGENAGRTITYVNILTDLVAVARWDGAPQTLRVPLPQDARAALFVQENGQGAVLAARWLN